MNKTVKSNLNENVINYNIPYIASTQDNDNVILVIEDDGIYLKGFRLNGYIGYYSDTWIREKFKPYDKEVILKNGEI